MIAFVTGVTATLFSADLMLKQYVEENLNSKEERKLMGGKVRIRKVYNKGLILNLLDEYPEIIKGISVASGLSLLVYDAVLLSRKGRRTEKIGMAILSAGAAGNLFDRLVRGKVIDYIGFQCGNKFLSDLTFNLADVCIVAGSAVTALRHLKKENRKK